jgi:hypothetical protein
LRGGIGPGQEFVDAAVRMAVDDFADQISEIGVRIDAVEFAGLDQRSNDRPMFAAAVGAGEQRILSVLRDGPNAAFHYVGIDLDAAVVEDSSRPIPARERIADRLGELGLRADQGELGAQSGARAHR